MIIKKPQMAANREVTDREQRELERLCRWWQKRLNLSHWDVSVTYMRANVMEGRDKAGEIAWQLGNLSAWISIRDPVDVPTDPHQHDVETTLVHELLHLWIAPFQPESDNVASTAAMEQAVNRIAEALVRMKREGGKKSGKRRKVE